MTRKEKKTAPNMGLAKVGL